MTTDCPAAGVPVTVMKPALVSAASTAADCSALAGAAPPAGAISTEPSRPPAMAPACGTSGSVTPVGSVVVATDAQLVGPGRVAEVVGDLDLRGDRRAGPAEQGQHRVPVGRVRRRRW